jgi:hypothetical protein
MNGNKNEFLDKLWYEKINNCAGIFLKGLLVGMCVGGFIWSATRIFKRYKQSVLNMIRK